MKKILTVIGILCIGASSLFAQSVQVSGTVTSVDDGNTLPGVTVQVKGTTGGTVTDVNGKYSIDVPQGGTLVFSFVGMTTQEIAVENRQIIDVAMEAGAQAIDEVIVVAYGTAKKSSFTGSATVVKSDELQKIQATNVTNALVGKVSGMQIMNTSGQPGTSSPSVRVRGIGSINAGNDPLIVVDGAPFPGDMNMLNTMDIESITVLKDAVSNALYGSRGANGVVLVTTKKGAAGEARITVDAKWGVNSRSVQDYNYIKDPGQYYEMYYGALKDYYINGQSRAPEAAHEAANRDMIGTSDYSLGYNVYNVPAGQYLIGTNGKLNPNATLGNVVRYNGQDYLLTPDNWLDATYRQSLRKEYNFSASSGNEKSSYYLSAGYLDNEGITDNSGFKRLTTRMRADYQAKPWMKIGGNVLYANYKFDQVNPSEDGAIGSSGNVFAFATRMAPIYPIYVRDGNGNIMTNSNGVTMYDYGDKMNAGLSRPMLGNSNGLGGLYLDPEYGEGHLANAVGFAEITFLKDFKFTTQNTMLVSDTRLTQVTNPYYGQNASSNGIVYKQHDRLFAYNMQQLLTWTKNIGLHHLNVLAGHEYSRAQLYYLYAQKSNMFDPGNHELNGAVSDLSPGSYTTDYNTEGFLSRVLYDYDEKYFASLSYRRDASSRFHPDYRWGNFWSAGLGWVISREDRFDLPSWVDMLKLKASYGQQGNDNISNYRYTDTYSIVNSAGKPAAIPDTKGNERISWETNNNFNAGFDFALFDERLTGTAEYYYRKTTDMLAWFTLPPSMGWTGFYDNIGDMLNTGLELDLKGTPVKTGDLIWDLRLNLTLQRNKIVYLPDQRKTQTTPEGVRGYASGEHFYGEGQPMFSFYDLKYAGVSDNGEATYLRAERDVDGNIVTGGETTAVTTPSEADQFLCGTALPDAFGGFGTTLNFKGIDFSIDFVYQLGGLVNDIDYQGAMEQVIAGRGGSAFHADLLNSWTPANTNTNIPRFRAADEDANTGSNRFYTDASYLSLQNISLGYSLPKRICDLVKVERVRVYAVCDNVWLWSKRQGLDPRQNFDGSTTSAFYAPMRTISGGLTITF